MARAVTTCSGPARDTVRVGAARDSSRRATGPRLQHPRRARARSDRLRRVCSWPGGRPGYMAAGEPAKIRPLVSMLLRRLAPLLIGGAIASAILAVPVSRALHFASPLTLPVAYAVLAGLLTSSIVRSASRGAQQFGQFA